MKSQYIFWLIGVAAALGVSSIVFPEGVGAIVMISIGCAIALPILLRHTNDPNFITRLFIAGLLVRMFFGSIIYIFGLGEFFGGDALTYHARGGTIVDYWHGLIPAESPYLSRILSTSGAGWRLHWPSRLYLLTSDI
jgi:hypothetical protein